MIILHDDPLLESCIYSIYSFGIITILYLYLRPEVGWKEWASNNTETKFGWKSAAIYRPTTHQVLIINRIMKNDATSFNEE